MSITLSEQPLSLTQKKQKLIYFGSSTNSLQDNFKYVVKFEQIGISGTELKFYIAPNPNLRIVFDLAPVVRDIVNVDVTDIASGGVMHNLPHYEDKFMSIGSEGCRWIILTVYEAYGTTLTEYPATSVVDLIYLLSGGFQTREGFKPTMSDYQPISDTKKAFLTERPRVNGEVRIKASESDYGTLSFINDSGTNFNSNATKLRYRIYNSGGLQGTEVFTIGTTYGSQSPSATAGGKLTYFGAYPANVNLPDHPVTGVKPEDITDWTYITWELIDDALNEMSQPLYIENTPNPCKHESVNLAWANNLGAWDYWRFDARTKRNIRTERKEYQKTIGDYSGTEWSMNAYDRETKAFQIDSRMLYEIESEGLVNEESDYIKNIMSSDNVMMYVDNQWLPVNVKTGSLSFQTEPLSKRSTVKLNVELAQAEC